MKWLFAILVALNIVVFGSMVASKLAHSNAAVPDPAASAAAMPTAPAEPNISVAGAIAASASSPHTDAKAVPASQPLRTATAASATPSSGNATTSAANCSATAVLPEDDYHRLKGLLNRWPHSATRFMDTSAAAPAKAKAKTSPSRYMVSISDTGSNVAANLKAQGFDYAINQGQVSLGVFTRRADAEALMARAKLNGFGSAQVVTLGGQQDNQDDTPVNMAKMRVTFNQASNQDVQDISRIIGRYGKLQHGNCRP